MQNTHTQTINTEPAVTLISMGRHTRLGDALETALEGIPFRTIEAKEVADVSLTTERLLFCASADAAGENADLRALAARLNAGELRLDGCACAMIADGEQGGAIHLDALTLLISANGAGAAVIRNPLLEAGRDLRALAGGSGKTPFARYQSLARALTLRLRQTPLETGGARRVRLASALEEGITNDWHVALNRALAGFGAALCDDADAEETIILCENTAGLPDEMTLALLDGGGSIRFLIASPTSGSELYTAALMECACIRGSYALPPRAITVFAGMSAVEALAGKREQERIKSIFA